MDASQKKSFSFWRMFGWNCVGGLIAPVLALWFDRGWTGSSLVRTTLMGMAYSHTIGTLATITFIGVLPFYKRRNATYTWALVLSTLVALGVLGSLIATGIIVLLGILPARNYWALARGSMQIALPITLGLGVVSGMLQELNRRLDHSNQLLRERETERERAVQLATEARLASLESRVHPHFLFNALNSIASLIREEPERAERLIEKIAALLRASLDSSRNGLVPLGLEMKIVDDYLEIEKARFGPRLQFSLMVPAELETAGVPSLSVQTLVENAVKFAVSPRREGGVIEVSATAGAGVLQVQVWDDGGGFDLQAAPPGHGLENLQGRLGALFGPGAELSVSRERDGTAVTLAMPLRKVEVSA